ncbi:MAG: hypothetical protein PQJ59_16835 [Spirochaetales bacterium]|nr:hypothetical protein [Spirochaetales bacterium]
MNTNVTPETIKKFLERKCQRGSYGSVQIFVKDGRIEQVNDQISYNADTFNAHVNKAPKRYIVKSNENEDAGNIDEKVTEVSKNDQNVEKVSKKEDNFD